MINPLPYRKKELSKWLLTVSLFFSFLCFSGYSDSYQPIKQTAQTEFFSTYQDKTSLFSYVLSAPCNVVIAINKYINNVKINKTAVLVQYNIGLKSKFDHISKLSDSYKPRHFGQVKTIPQCSDEDFSPSILG